MCNLKKYTQHKFYPFPVWSLFFFLYLFIHSSLTLLSSNTYGEKCLINYTIIQKVV